MCIATFMWCYIFYSVGRNVGYFFFENGLFQQFTLQLCESTSCINCYITIHSKRPPPEDKLLHLLHQRQSLLNYLESSVAEVNKFFMPSAEKPVCHLECPFEHENDCPPHLPFNLRKQDKLFLCQCNNRRMAEIVPEVCYIQLFEATHIPGQKSKWSSFITAILSHIHTM